ncbi:hypothetical protein PU560_03520 [Georgenia sp. 10Sc9-8]|uniref:Uncharacterized protein n=1 Tax=Georgenia halotolerans TaxID=3028317 RepID=A0ABT5TTZ8_9MICO|nr:hypothetical protein [Georgenia halotolerans]
MRRFVRTDPSSEETVELAKVVQLAELLEQYINENEAEIDEVHVFRAQSGAVQGVISRLLKDGLGFGEEVVIRPAHGLVTRARPDFFYALSPGRGVIAEVERGGTTTNNHDLKDLWKAHISPSAQHLFLIVPVVNWREDGSVREKPFQLVCHRLAAFFGDPRREVDVLSVHVLGYGGRALSDPVAFDSQISDSQE